MDNLYKIQVYEDDDTGMDFNSFVDYPASMKNYIAFAKDLVKYEFNEDKRTVTGVMISVGTPIFRNDKELGDHYVLFDAPTAALMVRKWMRNGFSQNSNIQHNPKDISSDKATLQYVFACSNSDDKLPSIPQVFEKMRLMDGTIFATYHIHNDEMWSDVKQGKFGGFSPEGWFDKVKVNVTKKVKMSKDKKSVWDTLKTFFDQDEASGNPAKFATATTADGTVLSYEGEISEGVQFLMEVDGESIPAPEGEHQVTTEDGLVFIVQLDGSGVITAIEEFIESTEDVQAEVMSKMIAKFMARFDAQDARIVSLESSIDKFNAHFESISKGENFNHKGKVITVPTTKMSISQLLKNKTK